MIGALQEVNINQYLFFIEVLLQFTMTNDVAIGSLIIYGRLKINPSATEPAKGIICPVGQVRNNLKQAARVVLKPRQLACSLSIREMVC